MILVLIFLKKKLIQVKKKHVFIHLKHFFMHSVSFLFLFKFNFSDEMYSDIYFLWKFVHYEENYVIF